VDAWHIAALVAAALAATPAMPAPLTPLGLYYWNARLPGFGGLSGLIMDADGVGLLTVSDRGTLFRARIERDRPGGRIARIAVTWQGRPKDAHLESVAGFREDAEALSPGPDGTTYIGFEGYTRVSAFHLPDLSPTATHTWDRFRSLWGNGAIEALATLPDGALMAVVERPRTESSGYPVLIGRDGDWRAGANIPVPDDYAAVGADVGPDGMLYLLERRFALGPGYSTRVRRFALAGDGIAPGMGEVLLATDPGELDNMEGISLWRDAGGRMVMTLISDDNFLPIQNTMVAEYIVAEAPVCQADCPELTETRKK
jgi:hypothetical protein